MDLAEAADVADGELIVQRRHAAKEPLQLPGVAMLPSAP